MEVTSYNLIVFLHWLMIFCHSWIKKSYLHVQLHYLFLIISNFNFRDAQNYHQTEQP